MRREAAARRRYGWVALAMVVLTVSSVVGACYAPTEVTLTITRDVSCSQATTGIFVGPPGHGAIDPVAETDDCAPAIGGSSIGSLVAVPSGARDERVTIEVAIALQPLDLNVPRKTPKECLVNAKDCIVARRSFAFIRHTSRVIPIRLYENCRDRTCEPGKTCIADECKPDDIDSEDFCDPETCGRRPADAGAPPVDALAVVDALADAPAVVDSGPCTGPKGDGVVAEGVLMPHGRIFGGATTLIWLAQGAMSVEAVGMDGTWKKRPLYSAAAAIPGLAISGDNAWFTENGTLMRVGPLSDFAPLTTVVAPVGGDSIGIAATGANVYLTASVDGGGGLFKVQISAGATTLVAPSLTSTALSAREATPGVDHVYANDLSGLYRFNPLSQLPLPLGQATGLIAASGGAFFANTSLIRFVPDGMFAMPVTRSTGDSPKDLTLDGTTLFWTEPARIVRLGPEGGVPLLIPSPFPVVGLAVDKQCVYYWANNAIHVAAKNVNK